MKQRAGYLTRAAGEEHFLNPLLDMDRLETGSERMRRLYRESGDWRHVIAEMKSCWTEELAEPGMKGVTAMPLNGQAAAQRLVAY